MSYWDKLPGLSEEGKKLLVKRARNQATVCGVMAIAALMSLVYAFVQQTEATKNMELYRVQNMLLEEETLNQKRRCKEAEAEALRWRDEFVKCTSTNKK